MQIAKSLVNAKNICLAPISREKDAEIESCWTHDAEYIRMLSVDNARPLAPSQLIKKYETIEKEMDEDKNLFYFTIRMLSDDRLIGFSKLYRVEWSNGTALIQLGIGDPADRNKGYGSEVLNLMLRFAFAEINLFRLTAYIPEYNKAAMYVFKKMGFIEEVRRREAINRDGRRWDMIHLGILQPEWTQLLKGKNRHKH